MLKALFGLNGRTGATDGPDAPLGRLSPTASPLLEDVARPIAGPSGPCGIDVSYHVDFERLKTEVDRLTTVSVRIDHRRALAEGQELRRASASATNRRGDAASRTPARPLAGDTPSFDVALVISLAQSILAEKSKDLRVAGWLALGLARRDGLPGVVEGAAVLDTILRTYWDGLYPPAHRAAGRTNAIAAAIGWLSDAAGAASVVDRNDERLAHARGVLGALRDTLVALALPELALRAGVLGDTIERMSPAPAAQPAPVLERPATIPVAVGIADAASVRAPAPVASGRSEGSAFGSTFSSATQAGELIARAALFLGKEDPRRALPYRLIRVARWDPLTKEPPAERGRTRIEPPAASRRAYFQELHRKESWETIVQEGEAAIAEHPFHFWLDLQRFTATALARLGAEFAPAHEAVLAEVRRLTGRLPKLSTLSYADGTRLADQATVAWLGTLVAPKAVPAQASAPAPAPVPARAMAPVPLPAGVPTDLAAALAVLQQRVETAASARERFTLRLSIAELCQRAGQVELSRAMLEELEERVAAAAAAAASRDAGGPTHMT